jgi:hypothetical protein
VSDITHLPTRAEFIRDRLAEWAEAQGYAVEIFTFDGLAAVDIDTFYGVTWRAVVDDFGAFLDRDEHWRQFTARNFTWLPEPTDTGVMHGPSYAVRVLVDEGYGPKPVWHPRPFPAVSGATRTV